MVTVRRLLIGGRWEAWHPRLEREWGAVGWRYCDAYADPCGTSERTGNRQALSQWGPVNTTNRFSMLSNPPRLQELLPLLSFRPPRPRPSSSIHPSIRAYTRARANRRETLLPERYERVWENERSYRKFGYKIETGHYQFIIYRNYYMIVENHIHHSINHSIKMIYEFYVDRGTERGSYTI